MNIMPGKIIVFICFTLAGVLVSPLRSSPQGGEQDTLAMPLQTGHLELPEDKYIPVPPEGRKTSPAYNFSTSSFFAVQVNVDQSGQNIVGDAANETSIAIDPTNPSRMAIGWRQFNTIKNNFRQAGYGYSADGGQTWVFPGVIEPGNFRSDPVLDADNAGNFYYYSLSDAMTCEIFKSTNGGASWLERVPAYGGDKGWMTIDRTGGVGDGNIYCFSRVGISWTIAMTRSLDGGQSFQPLVNVPGNPGSGTIAVGVDGEVYTVGRSWDTFQHVLARSTNAFYPNVAPVFEFSTTFYPGGSFSRNAGPNPGGGLGQTEVACDFSSGPGRGNVYVLSSVDPLGLDPLDVYFVRSTDKGQSWSHPVRINDDPGTEAWQWFGTMSVAPDGRIDAVWLDTRDNPGTFLSALYYSYSHDAGQTWSQNERLSDFFDPHLGWPMQEKMGDYFDLISDVSGASIAWAATFNGEQDVYYGRISQPVVAVEEEKDRIGIPGEFSLSQNYPNPFNPQTIIRYELSKTSRVALRIYNTLGQEIRTLVDEKQSPGEKTAVWDGRNGYVEAVGSGVYIYRIQVDANVKYGKMILLR